MVGQTFSHYRILSRLGAGGMGVVYRALDERLEREVALKFLPAEAVADETARLRLLREARLASQLNHPNICTIYEVGEAEGQAYLAMELVEGRSLHDLLGARGLPPESVVRHGTQIADALAYAHGQGVVHRDLKPANVIVTADGRVKVLDFGLAIRVGGPDDRGAATRQAAGLTRSGAILGTPHFMAPEVLRGGVADARSDLWSLGVVLYEMASGARPFQGTTEIEVGGAILHAAPHPLPARVPPGLAAIIRRCLEKDPVQRYRQAGEVRAALEALGHAGLAAGATTPRAPRRGRSGLRGRFGLALGAAALLLLAAAVLLDVGGIRSRLLPGGDGPRIRSLAVLPLDNFSNDPEQRYFADAMTEELITALAQIGGLRVISRTSIMGFRETKLTLPEIGRQLGVDAIVEGSVHRSGNRVRISAQLIRASNDEHLWAHSYERELSDALALQSEVAAAIVGEVRVQLTPQERRRMETARPVSPVAYDHYLRGRDAYHRWQRPNLKAAVELLSQAIREDSTYAPAWAALGLVYIHGIDLPGGRAEELARTRQAAARAMALDPDLGLAHTLQALIDQEDWNWTGAERAFRRAIELSPSLFDAHHMYSHLLLDLGRLQESETQSRVALALDPLNTAATLHMGWHLLVAGQYEEAIAMYEKTLRLDPSYTAAYEQLPLVYLLAGRAEEARAARAKEIELTGGREPNGVDVLVSARQGHAAESERLLSELLASADKVGHALDLASVYAQFGRQDDAFVWLERAVARRDPGVSSIKLDPFLAPLRGDPRFADLVRRMGLPG